VSPAARPEVMLEKKKGKEDEGQLELNLQPLEAPRSSSALRERERKLRPVELR